MDAEFLFFLNLLQVLQYNVPGGKKNRGLALVLTYKLLKSKLTKDEIFLAQVMGWCIEIVRNN